MNEDEKNDWDRKADEIDQVMHLLLICACPIENHVTLSAADYLAALHKLERVKGHCQGLAESHRVFKNTGKEGT